MKSLLKICSLLLVSLITNTSAHAQQKTKHFKVEKIINVPADKVWAVVAEDYDAIANSHPQNYLFGTYQRLFKMRRKVCSCAASFKMLFSSCTSSFL